MIFHQRTDAPIDSAWVHQVEAELVKQVDRLAALEARQERLEVSLQLNTEATFEIHDILSAAKGAFKVFGWVGGGLTWALKLGAALATAYAAAKIYFPHWFPK